MEACALNRCVYSSKSTEPRRGKRFLKIIRKFRENSEIITTGGIKFLTMKQV